MGEFYGKYRAQVIDREDPEKRGRVRVACPSVLGETLSAWCEVCVPIAFELGGDHCPLKVEDFIWIEFERGNPDSPIVVGAWWARLNKNSIRELPTDNDKEIRVIEFNKCQIFISKENEDYILEHLNPLLPKGENIIMLSNEDGISIETRQGNKIIISNEDGISLTAFDGGVVTIKGGNVNVTGSLTVNGTPVSLVGHGH